ncbi:MAG: hypothetical protein R3308_09580 [Thiohalobacterales bacterium]|nr:hypothetical protein [Thiohalobacterales bacterium]
MSRPLRNMRPAATMAVILLLQGCAAATVIREQPDFEENNRQRLLQHFGAASVAAVRPGAPDTGSDPDAVSSHSGSLDGSAGLPVGSGQTYIAGGAT